MSVRHSVQGGGSPQVNITHDALDLTVQAPWPQSNPLPPDLRHGPPAPGSSLPASDIWGHYWRPVQTCSLEDPSTGTDIWWPPKHIRLASGW